MLLACGLLFHKAIELSVQTIPARFSMALRFAFNGSDHAGFHFRLQLFGRLFELSVYDQRHWSYSHDRWMLPGEEETDDARLCDVIGHEE